MRQLSIFLCFVYIVVACKKPSSIGIDPTIKKYFSYKKGTYWIYKDSLTGFVDSFVVLYNDLHTESTNNGTVDFESDNITIYRNGQVFDSAYCYWQLIGGENNIGFHYEGIPQPLNYNTLFVYPFPPVGQYSASKPEKYVVQSIYNQIQIAGNNYNNVAEIFQTDDQNSFGDYFYVNTDVGIIKMKLNHPTISINSTRELIRYKILH